MKPFLIVLGLILASTSALGQTNSVVVDNIPNNEAMYYFHERKVARSTDGTLMVVWVDLPSNTAGGQVLYSVYDPVFQIWSPPVAVSNAADRARQPALAADDMGNIHCVWMQRGSTGEPYQQWYSRYSGTWTTPVQVSVAASVRAEEGTIEAGSDGTVWVAYNNDGQGVGNEYVYVVKSTDMGTTWSTSADTISSGGEIGSSITNARVALAAATGGKIAAVWHDGQPWDRSRREIFFNSYDGASWGTPEMISDTTTSDRSANWYPTVTVDYADNIYVFYHTNDPPGSSERKVLMQKKAWADPWSSSTTSVVAIDTLGDLLSISAVADSNNYVHLSYRRDMVSDATGLDEIVFTFTVDGGASWHTPIIMSRPQHDGGYVSLANRVRRAYGVDLAWRESRDTLVNDQDTLTAVSGNIPYSITSVELPNLPESFEVMSIYPNPFNPSTTIEFTLQAKSKITLAIYDATGRLVKTLVEGERDPGLHRELWDGRDAANLLVSSGPYFSRLTTESRTQTIKMILIK